MKKALRILFILMIMISTVVTFAYMRMDQADKSQTHIDKAADHSTTASNENAAHSRTLFITDRDFAMQTGQSHQCTAQFDDGGNAEGLLWSSTNENAVTVDDSGRVTAVGAGDAEIWAVMGRNYKARVKVSVYDDLDAAAAEAVTVLAADGSDESMNRLEDMAAKLSRSKSKSALRIAAMLASITDFRELGATGGEDAQTIWTKLIQRRDAAGMESLSEKTLRQAALAAYCQGEKSAAELTLSFTGDCTFAYFNEERGERHFPAVYLNSGSVSYPFDLTRGVFGADDLTMINFEGALTNSLAHKQKQFYFRGEPEYVKILTSSSVEAVTLENNHSFDYFDTGFNDTMDIMRDAGIRYTSFHSPAVINVNGCRVVMLSLCMIGIGYQSEFSEQVNQYISRYKDDDTLIVMNVHWGVESAGTPEPYQIEAAHQMIDAGVDLVIGHHPHVLQGIEVYKGHYIAYSLGNFSFGGNTAVSNSDTIIFRASFDKSGGGSMKINRISVVPCCTTSSGSTVNNYQPSPLFGSNGQAVIDRLIERNSNLEGGAMSLMWNGIP